MTRHVRKTVIQVEIESSAYGSQTGITWGATSAVLIAGNPSHTIRRDTVPRDLIRPYFGAAEHLIASRVAEITFDIELAASGTAGTAPAFAKLLRACGMAQFIPDPADWVQYTPITDAQESVAMRFFIDGVMYVSRGCRGNVTFDLTAYQRPMMSFRFLGYDTSASEQALPATNFTTFQRPLVVSDGNSGDIAIGGTYAAGVVTGGTILPSRGMQIDLGNNVAFIPLLGGEAIDISGRETTGKFVGALSAADEVAWRTALNTNTLAAFSFRHGTAGHRVAIHAPAVQRLTPEIQDLEGRHMVAPDLRFLPVSGNDEIRLVFS